MTIADYTLFQVPRKSLLLRLETTDGQIGWGEASLGSAYYRVVEAALEELLRTRILDADPTDIEDCWQLMYRGGFYRGGPILMSAISAIDQALWDLKGKRHSLPIYELLGGKVRDRMRVYQHLDNYQDTETLAEEAEEHVDSGFTALKMNASRGKLRRIDSPAGVKRVVDRMASVRDAVGDEVDVALDFHGRATKAMATRLVEKLEPYEPMFVEEPVLPEHEEALIDVADSTSIPIATGERLYSRWDFKSVLKSGAIDVAQPDASHAAGITETKRICDMAEAYDVSLSLHCPLGPVALAAAQQLNACSSNALIQEQTIYAEKEFYGDAGAVDQLGFVENPEVFDIDDDGYLSFSDEPGLGITVDEDYVEEHEGLTLESSVWRYEDGSFAEK